MEETDMCYVTRSTLSLQQAIPNTCTAKTLGPGQRLTIGVQALAGQQSITTLAEEFDVSRKFVYRQADIAQAALEDAFSSAVADDQVLFYLPVTKAWLRQVTLALLLICHSSYRGVIEFCRDLLAVKLALGTIYNIVHDAVTKARFHNQCIPLDNIDIAGLDEIFQNGLPVLVGADIRSTYCFLLSQEEHRDADTWGIRLLEAKQQGFAPKATVADFGAGIRAGQKLAMSAVPCYGDVFHAEMDLTALVSYLENRAYDAIAAHDKLHKKKAKTKQQGRPAQSISRKASLAQQAETKAIALADNIAVLARWLQGDVFAVSALPYAERCCLYDFILGELQACQPSCPHRIGPSVSLLQNHRDELLAFAAQLDNDLHGLAATFELPVTFVRDLFDLQALDQRQPQRWQKEQVLRRQLGQRFYALEAAVRDVRDHVVRASSIIENINSRLRSYFFLRRHLGNDYLVLLQFFLNHRRFLRSERCERVGKSPAELLTGTAHPHWLEMLGYQLFTRSQN
jgi:hypothetical protein